MKKYSAIIPMLLAGLTFALFSCEKEPKPDNPAVIETPGAQFTVVLHEEEPCTFTDLSGDGSSLRKFSGRWSDASRAFEMWDDYGKARAKVDADLFTAVPVTSANRIRFSFESDDPAFKGVNAAVSSGAVKITRSGSGRDVTYSLEYQSDADLSVTFWTGEQGSSGCVSREIPVISRGSVAMEGIEVRITKYGDDGEIKQTGVFRATTSDGLPVEEEVRRGKYTLQGITIDWLASMFPEYGDWYGGSKWKYDGKQVYHIKDFDPHCIDPDVIRKKTVVEILGAVPRYATPDVKLQWGYDKGRQESVSSSWKTEYRGNVSCSKYYYSIWNYEKNPDCTWFPRNRYTGAMGSVNDANVDISPADLRGRRIHVWDWWYGGYMYKDGLKSCQEIPHNLFAVCFCTRKDSNRSYYIVLNDSIDESDLQPEYPADN